MTNDEINAAFRALDQERHPFVVRGLEKSGKVIPYLGWFWRTVDFDREVWFGYFPGDESTAPFVAFMENNKWGYEEFVVRDPQRLQQIKALSEEVAREPILEHCQSLFDYLQTLCPVYLSKQSLSRWRIDEEEEATE